ncbi:unnamed protein product [Ectocarpus sp. 13 AM-2016]
MLLYCTRNEQSIFSSTCYYSQCSTAIAETIEGRFERIQQPNRQAEGRPPRGDTMNGRWAVANNVCVRSLAVYMVLI